MKIPNNRNNKDNKVLLRTFHLTKMFDGLTAINCLDIIINVAEILAIIGPNGSGKTTLFNLITGLCRPTSGTILYGQPEESLVSLSPEQIAAKGIGRTFQNIRLFDNMSVLENVLVGMHLRLGSKFICNILRPSLAKKEENHFEEEAFSLLSIFGTRLLSKYNEAAITLSQANRRRLEIVRALALRPQLLLLDEPSSGMNPTEKNELTRDIKKLRKDKGISVVSFIEHDMRVVKGIADRVIVLSEGTKIAEGSYSDIKNNLEVFQAYLGGNVRNARTQKCNNLLRRY